MARTCDYCNAPVPTVIPAGIMLCPCGARLYVVGDDAKSCERPERKAKPSKPRGRPLPRLTPYQVDKLRELAIEGARLSDLVEGTALPYYLVRKVCSGCQPRGPRPSYAKLTRAYIERRCAEIMGAEVSPLAASDRLSLPATVLPERAQRALVDSWLSYPLAARVKRAREVAEAIAFDANVSVATLRDVLYRECYRIRTTSPDMFVNVARQLGLHEDMVSNAFARYDPAIEIDTYTCPVAPDPDPSLTDPSTSVDDPEVDESGESIDAADLDD